jgi:hypothetical protein
MKFSIRSSLLLTAGCAFFAVLASSKAVAGKIPQQALAGTYTITGGESFAVCTGPAPSFTEIDPAGGIGDFSLTFTALVRP